MLKSGYFIDSKGNEHTVYVVEANNYSRTDICEVGAQFQIEPHKVRYSILKRRKTYIYGDPSIKEEMDEFVNTLRFAKLQDNEAETSWEGGTFKQRITRGSDNTFFTETVMVNGRIESETFVKDKMLLSLQVLTHDNSMALDPINRNDYEELELESTVVTSASPYVPSSVLKTRFNLSWLKDREYIVVKDLEVARRLMRNIDLDADPSTLIGIDTETDSLEFNLHSTGKMVGVIISPAPKISWYFPFRHTKFDNLPMSFLQEIADFLKASIRKLVAHNKKFEKKVFKKEGVEIYIHHDSMQVSLVENPVLVKGAHSLKNLMAEISGLKFLEFEDIFLDKANINFADLDEETTRIYACPDSDNTRVVFEEKYKKLPVYSHYIYELETQLADIKADQEYWGMRVNTAKFMEGYRTCEYVIGMLEKMIHALVRSEIKLTSSDQLIDLLYNKMKCPIYMRTKTGKASTGAKAIKKLAREKIDTPRKIVSADIRDDKGKLIVSAIDLDNSKYPVVVLLEKHREYVKLQTAFYNRIVKGSVGSRYFFWINQNGAESGRQSSPMHQLPKEIKGDIQSDSSHHSITGADYSQIELRLTFSLAGETVLIDLCGDPDNDIHRAVDSGISGVEMWEISSEVRQQGKSRNFGVIYLISGQGLAVQRHGAAPTKEQIKIADKDLDAFFSRFKRVAKFIKDNRKKVETKGVMTTFFGRNRYFPQVFDPDLPRDKKNTIIRQGNNHPVQGTAADIMKQAEVNLNNYIIEKGWDKLVETPEGWFPLARVMISAHDEALISHHYSIPVEEILEMQVTCMEMTIEGGVGDDGKPIKFAPLFTSAGIIDNWEEGKADEYQIPYRLRERMIENYKKTGVSVVNQEIITLPDGTQKPNTKELMLEVINKYRDEELVVYMEEIIKEVGEDAEAVANKVRHPSLTHELISRFSQTKEHKKQHGKLDHISHIKYSTELYLQFRKDPNFVAPDIEEPVAEPEESTMKEYFEEISGLSEEVSYMDDKGEIHYYTDSQEVEQEYGMFFDDEMDYIDRTTSGETIRCWQLFDRVVVSTEGLTVAQCDELLKLLYKYNVKDGFSEVYLHHVGSLVNTGIRAEDVDMKEINDFLEKLAPINTKQEA